ncbi:MAG: hypothetical protein F4Y98_06080 [Chloroflexi bacterium]|nr:hypothetical protein [Chloroflexota bacterium]
MAYSEMEKGIGSEAIDRVYQNRFGLRRWSAKATAVLEEWDRYLDRPRISKLFARSWRSDRLDRAGQPWERTTLALMRERTNEILATSHEYRLGESGELLPENHSPEAYAAMRDEYLAAVGE